MYYKENKDFSSRKGLEKAFRFEAFHPRGEIFLFWENHFVENAEKLNSNPTNRPGLTYEMLRYISKHNNLVMTFEHLAEKFKLKDREEAKKRAYQLVAADLARRGTDIFFSIHGIPDPILPLVLPQIQHQKSTKQKGIEIISPESLELMNKRLNKIDKDIKETQKEVEKTGKRVKSIGGDLNRLKGGEFEDKVKEAIKQDATILNGYKIIGDIERKFVGKRGKSEKDIDLYAMLESKKRKKSKKTQNQRIALAVETKNWKSKVVRGAAQAFVEKVEMAKQQDQLDKIVAIFVNTGGFSAPAQKILEKAGIEVTTGDQWNLSIKITKK